MQFEGIFLDPKNKLFYFNKPKNNVKNAFLGVSMSLFDLLLESKNMHSNCMK